MYEFPRTVPTTVGYTQQERIQIFIGPTTAKARAFRKIILEIFSATKTTTINQCMSDGINVKYGNHIEYLEIGRN